MIEKPQQKPQNPNFSSGPCAKRPGWNLLCLEKAAIGRSHRSKIGKEKLAQIIEQSRQILCIPQDYKIGIVPASDTGAVEMAMWNLLGTKNVDVLAWESFGSGWASDIINELKLANIRIIKADYGNLPNLTEVDSSNDIVFTYNGTTSGVKVPNCDWIKDKRKGLTICDATSAVFAMDLEWNKLDVTTWSWQKVMGGEAAHGMIVLSPRAIERLETYTPAWPIPKIFRLTKKGKLIEDIFTGATINTPSMLCVEDALDGLAWAKQIGGLKELIKRSENNLTIIKNWVYNSPWANFLAQEEATISNTSICLKITDSWYQSLNTEQQQNKAKELVKLLETENVAYDIGSYRDAPPGLRIWGGATIESTDIEKLLPWLDFAFHTIKQNAKTAA